jgi:hypothetical protein
LGLALLAVTALAAIAELALADEHGAKFPRPIWSLQLPEGLRGRLYQVVIQSGERPTALATSPEAVVELSNEVRVVLPVPRHYLIRRQNC